MTKSLAMASILLWASLTPGRSAVIFDHATTWNYFKATTEPSSPAGVWRQITFNDSSWLTSDAPFFYENGSGYSGNTDLTDMFGLYSGIAMRKVFQVGNPADVNELMLDIRSDDGCIVWINGVEVARVNMPAGDVPFSGTSNGASGEPNQVMDTILDPDFLVAGDNIVAIQAMNASIGGSSDFLISMSLSSSVDLSPPVVENLIPPSTATVRELFQVEIFFSENVAGVDPGDLLINGDPATDLIFGGAGQLIFSFPSPEVGLVEVRWAPNHGISDQASTPNAFIPGPPWTFILDPDAEPPGLIISEFMADNNKTINDEDGNSSDWIEIFNAGNISGTLSGWYLTDDPADLTQWRFPGVNILPGTYLIVFASGEDRSNPIGELHANFRLPANGGYLALVDELTNVVSEFLNYPPQLEDVSYGRDRANPSVVGFFSTPTPRAQNTPGGAGFAPEVEFSRSAGTFVNSFFLGLSAPSPTAVVRFTLNGSLPSASSPVYTAPILISGTTEVRVRAFDSALLPGPPRSEHYILLNAGVTDDTSNLPMVILHNYGRGGVPASGEQFVVMQIFEPKNGRSSLTNAPDLNTRARFRLRGSSTQGIAKGSFAFESWDDFDDDKDISLLGMPPESDWVFYAPNQFDPVLIHNPFMMELSTEVGRYAPRARFVEVYLKDNSGTPGAVVPGDYNGVYVIMEKIKRDKGRVDIANLEPEHSSPPEVTGGYVLKIDRDDPGDSGFTGGGVSSINYIDPKEEEIELPQRDPQEQFIKGYFDSFGNALNGPNYTDPVNGYAPWIDVDSWIDHHILNILPSNVDAFRLSGYFHKPRNGKITMGPIWDFDRSLESAADNRDDNPRAWNSGFWNFTWWNRLFTDPNFFQKWIDRWQELQDGPLGLNALHAKIDDMTELLAEAQVREQNRWPGITTPRGGYENEVNIMKNWLSNRLDFANAEFLDRPGFSNNGGQISPGFNLAISGPAGATLYYTTDGTDPRAPGGSLAPGARIASGGITLNANARVVARARNLAHSNRTGGGNPALSSPWSGVRAATFIVQTPPLVISEIMYNPQGAPSGNTNDTDNFEFIELKNIGTTALNLLGVHFAAGIDFTFTAESPVRSLSPGQTVVLVNDQTAFTSRYGALPNIGGEYGGNLDNAGETLTLIGGLLEPILSFAYDDDWYRLTDGSGFSLVIVDENAPLTSWGNKSSWRISSVDGGSPGQDDPPTPNLIPVLVNEVLTHTDPPQVDAIELHNPTASPAPISGWFLTDDFAEPRKFLIPPGTTIPPGGFLFLTETNFNAVPGAPGNFSLSSKGEEVYLFSGNGTDITGYFHGFDFGASFNGASFGRFVTSSGADHFPEQISPTLGAANAGPRLGPVVISEIMYHPPDLTGGFDNADDEFIELANISENTVDLFDASFPENTWRLRNAVDFEFPSNLSMSPGGRLLVVNFDPIVNPTALISFRTRNGVSDSLPIYGPFRGKLDNSSETIELRRPDAPEPPPAPAVPPYVLVERVKYSDQIPWPVAADGIGPSLQRINEDAYGNDPLNWAAAAKTLGGAYVGGVPPTIVQHPASQTAIAFKNVTFSVTAGGAGPFSYQWRHNGSTLPGATSSTLTLNRVQPSQAGQYQVVVLNPANSVASTNATLTVLIPATITEQPESVVANVGDDVTFSVSATSSTQISYQWRKDRIPINGAIAPSLILLSVQPEDDASYDVVVTDGIGPLDSAPARLAVLVDPTIVVGPLGQTNVVGGSVTFSVQVTNAATLPISYRWRRGGQTLANHIVHSRTDFFTLSDIQPTDAREARRNIGYSVVVTNQAFFSPGFLSDFVALGVLETADTDGDGMPDDYENANGLNPNLDDAAADLDMDGFTNKDEFTAGTDPQDPLSFLKVEEISADQTVVIRFIAQPDKTYAVQFRDGIGGGPWQFLGGLAASRAPAYLAEIIDRNLQKPGTRYYRLVTPGSSE